MKHQIQTEPAAKRSVGRKTWNLFAKLPLFIRGPLIRRLFSAEPNLPANLVFKKADTPKEIEQAFNIAFEGYRQRGLVEDTEHRLRVTKFHALPTTSILVAKEDDDVIATITIVVDSAMGLPLEKLWNMDEIRKSSPRIAEISTLSIRKDHRSRRGRLLLPLMDYMQKYCLNVLGVEKIVASVHPEVADFYRCILLFNMINKGEVKTYDFVQGAAAVAGWLSLKDLPKNYKKVYGDRPSNRNMYHWFMQPPLPNYVFDDRTHDGCYDYSFTPSLLEYFFKHKTEVMKDLSPQERNVIANSYFHPEFTTVINSTGGTLATVERHQARFAVFYGLRLHVKKTDTTYTGNVLDVSRGGLRIYIPKELPLEAQDEVTVSMDLGEGRTLPLRALVSWNRGSIGQLGLQLNEFTPKAWHDLITHFEQDLIARTEKTASDQKIGTGR